MFLNLWIFQASIAEHGFDIRVDGAHKVKQDGGVLPAGERNHHVPVPMVVPLYDAGLTYLDLPLQRQGLQFLQSLRIVYCVCYI